MKILTVIGARPQIIKAAVMSKWFHSCGGIQEIICHTGQHYDANMSDNIGCELGIPKPNYMLSVSTQNKDAQLSYMILHIGQIIQKERPAYILVYGDTNSTLAGALAANQYGVPLIHIEAGLRSFNRIMSEEMNRILTDNIASVLFVPTLTANNNLIKENNPGEIYLVGDIMFDSIIQNKNKAEQTNILSKYNIPDKYVLTTIHRNFNTDNIGKLYNILKSLVSIKNKYNIHIVLPLHPRTKNKLIELNNYGTTNVKSILDSIQFIEPASYLEMLQLEMNAEYIITDSGGVQKEAYFLQKPCLVLRNETEWVEIVNEGCAFLVDDDSNKMFESIDKFKYIKDYPPLFGDGYAGQKIYEKIINLK